MSQPTILSLDKIIRLLASPIQLRLQFLHFNFVISFIVDAAALWLAPSSLSLNVLDKFSTGSFNFWSKQKVNILLCTYSVYLFYRTLKTRDTGSFAQGHTVKLVARETSAQGSWLHIRWLPAHPTHIPPLQTAGGSGSGEGMSQQRGKQEARAGVPSCRISSVRILISGWKHYTQRKKFLTENRNFWEAQTWLVREEKGRN